MVEELVIENMISDKWFVVSVFRKDYGIGWLVYGVFVLFNFFGNDF